MTLAKRMRELEAMLAGSHADLDRVLSAEGPGNDEIFSAAWAARDEFKSALAELRSAVPGLANDQVMA